MPLHRTLFLAYSSKVLDSHQYLISFKVCVREVNACDVFRAYFHIFFALKDLWFTIHDF